LALTTVLFFWDRTVAWCLLVGLIVGTIAETAKGSGFDITRFTRWMVVAVLVGAAIKLLRRLEKRWASSN
jgi:hypothetical protein